MLFWLSLFDLYGRTQENGKGPIGGVVEDRTLDIKHSYRKYLGQLMLIELN